MRPFGLLLALVLFACGAAEPVVPRSSSLLAMNSDRLWVLLQAAKVNPRCREYYAQPSGPRLAGLGEKCAAFERDAVAWLQANGVDDAREEDLREPAFWQWYTERADTIADCRRQELAKPHAAGSGSVFAGQNACDPCLKIVRVEKRSLSDAGIRTPGDQ